MNVTTPASNALIIFTKNMLYGKVKTRLAATIGNERAMNIYKKLVAHTHSITKALNCDKIVYYSHYIEVDDKWQQGYTKVQQKGADLGERMMNAFEETFKQSSNVIIIGTDCPALNESLINEAFDLLNYHDVVIGPSSDGGYYLLGLKKHQREFFQNIAWSTSTVLNTTLSLLDNFNLSYHLLPVLNDVDDETDLSELKFLHNDQHYHSNL